MHLAKDQATFGKKVEVWEEKLRGKSLLLDNIESMRLAKKPKGERKASLGAHMMSGSGRRKLDRLTTRDTFSYEKQLLPLHRLWLAYIKDLLSVSQYFGALIVLWCLYPRAFPLGRTIWMGLW